MSWEKGSFKFPKDIPDINQELLELPGYLEEKEAKYHLHQFLRNNITFTTDLIAGVELFPFQHIAIKG